MPFSVCAFSLGTVERGIKAMAFVILGVVFGAFCALLRYGVLMMLALSALLAVGVVLGGIIFHTHIWAIAAEAVGSIAASQFTCVAVSLTRHLVHSRRLIPQVQAAIGQQLGAELEVPRSLPPELSALVAQLQAA
jgi:hypothetical protein